VSSLWFVVPAAGRVNLTGICLRHLRHTCDQLTDNGVRASAVVVADDENLDTARDLGFATVRRDNRFTSRRFNDGIQLAMDKTYNPHPVTHVVPLGSDDWVDWRLFLELPPARTMWAFQHMAFVNETATELSVRHLNNEGGSGIRIYTRDVMRRVGFRPADEDRKRGCDTSILLNLKKTGWLGRIDHRDIDPLQIVDWKSPGENLNSYREVAHRYRAELTRDPFDVLAGRYPADALDEMRHHYAAELVAA
jgi:hypothetical protein